MKTKIAITTSSFAQYDLTPNKLLVKKGWDIVYNATKKTLTEDEVAPLLKGCQGVVAGTEKYSKSVLTQLPQLKVISRCGVGTDAIDLKACQKLGIKVLTTPDAPTNAVAELTISMALNLLRQVSYMDRQIRLGKWPKVMGSLFEGKSLGLVGFGRIGQKVGRIAKALGAEICFFDPYFSGKSKLGQKMKFQDILKKCDIISLHLPLSNETKYLIGAKELSLMQAHAILINCSRGELVDDQALYEALKNKKIFGAGLDVFEQEPYVGPMVELDNVLMTAHVGSYAKESRVQMELEAVKNLLKVIKK